MNLTRSKLLVALVLIGVSGVGVIDAGATTVKLDESPPSGTTVTSAYQPPASPDQGEPDVPNPAPRSTGATRERDDSSFQGQGIGPARSLAETLRWTWVIWMARYLNHGH